MPEICAVGAASVVVARRAGQRIAALVGAHGEAQAEALAHAAAGLERLEDLCSGPGKLTQALGIGLSLNGSSLVDGPSEVLGRERENREPRIVVGERVGITKAAELPWRFCDGDSRYVSRPWPAAMRRAAA